MRREIQRVESVLTVDAQLAALRVEGDTGSRSFPANLLNHISGRERGVSAKIHFDCRREPAQIVTIRRGANVVGRFGEIVFSRDGKFLAAAPEALLVQDLASGRPIFGQTQGKVLPDGMAFNSDGTILAAPMENNTVRLWNLSSHNEPSTFVQPAVAVGFSADDSFIYALTGEFEIYKYPWKLESVMAEAKKKIRSRELTDLQCKEYLHQETCPPEVSLPKGDGKNKAAR